MRSMTEGVAAQTPPVSRYRAIHPPHKGEGGER
jgi:hypothetical protein